MTHHRDLGVEDGFDDWKAFPTSLEFHRFGTTFPHQPASVANGVLVAEVEGQPGHVGHYESLRAGSLDGPGVEDDLVEPDLESRVHAVYHVGDRVTDENGVDTRTVGDYRPGIVVGSHDCDLWAAFAVSNSWCRYLAHFLPRGYLSRETTATAVAFLS